MENDDNPETRDPDMYLAVSPYWKSLTESDLIDIRTGEPVGTVPRKPDWPENAK